MLLVSTADPLLSLLIIRLHYLFTGSNNRLLLVFVVLYQALHVLQFSIQFRLLIVDYIHLTPQGRHIGLKHGLHI